MVVARHELSIRSDRLPLAPMTTISEIAPDLFRLSIYAPEIGCKSDGLMK